MMENEIDEMRAKSEREKKLERERMIKAGINVADLDEEDEEDYMGVRPLIEKSEKQDKKDNPSLLNQHEEPSDFESEDEYEEAMNQRAEMFEKKLGKHQELLKKFAKAGFTIFKVLREVLLELGLPDILHSSWLPFCLFGEHKDLDLAYGGNDDPATNSNTEKQEDSAADNKYKGFNNLKVRARGGMPHLRILRKNACRGCKTE